MLKKLTLAISAASAVTVSSFAAAETVKSPIGDFDVSMNAALTTDYIYRGVSQTQGKGAIQGGLDVAHDSGLYVGTWASNVDFIAADGNDANVEFDYYLGFTNNITDDISYDLGWIKYNYPGATAANYSEYYGSLTAYGFKVGAAYSDDFAMFGSNGLADDNTTLYTYIGYDYTLPYEIGLALQYGNYDFKDNIFLNSAGVGKEDSYNDWSIGLTKTYAGLDFGMTYTDTSLSDSECKGFAAGGKSDYCDANFVVSVSKSL
ncbi:TorF family putative porin [Pseudomonas brenneri]